MSLDYGLLAHYPLDGDGVDISGNHNNGVNDGAVPTTDRHGNSGKAMYFNGGAYITTTNELSFPALGNADRTLSGWFKTDKDDGIIVSLGGYGANHEYALAAETIGFTLYGKIDENDFVFSNSGNYVDDTWRFVAVTKSGDRSQLYMDGVYVGRTAAHTWDTSGDRIMIGQWSDWNRYFQGSIDDIRLYDRCLSPGEIQALYQFDFSTSVPTSKPLEPPTHIPIHGPTVESDSQPHYITANTFLIIMITGVSLISFLAVIITVNRYMASNERIRLGEANSQSGNIELSNQRAVPTAPPLPEAEVLDSISKYSPESV